ncbi:amidohydrolase family protein [Halobacillus sp. Marseille-Q1614]|uniref:amidohydrolase family protein n=1 Tax=Halobacillus sp. Marseille-Q1614 TaxID=2709134 RepID=UPI00156F22D7|nr:amidohydrolase family protein [Halobacillus sp. Marseille-Q1614]
MSLLIKNAQFTAIDSEDEVLTGSLLIEKGKIAKIFPGEPAQIVTADETIDASGKLIIPGMTNAHYHSYSNLLKGTTSNLPLEIWSLYTIAYGHSLDDEDIYLAVLLGAADMIRSGITGCIDHFPHLLRVESALKAYEKSKINVAFAPMIQDISDEEFLGLPQENQLVRSIDELRDFFTRLVKDWHLKNDKIRIMLGPNAPQRCSKAALALCREVSNQYGLDVHTHLSETKVQKDMGDRTFKRGLVGHLDEAGLLNSRLSAAHAIWLNENEIDLLKEKEVTIIHNPASNMMLGSGFAPVSQYVTRQIPIALGTDASNCGISHNSFEMMRLALMMSRVNNRNYQEWLEPKDVFKMAAVSGAEVITESKRGKIAEGYDADLVFLDKNSKTFISEEDSVSQMILYENGDSVDSVMIMGDWVYRDKKILAFDEQQVIQQIQEKAEKIRNGAKGALALAERKRRSVEKFYQHFYN